MDEISTWLNEVFLADAASWLRGVYEAGVGNPWIAGLIFGLALAVILASRSFSIAVAVLLLAMLLLEPLASAPGPFRQPGLVALAAIALVLLWSGCVGLRRRIRTQRAKLRQLSSERDEAQRLLDREVKWRRAGEAGTEARQAPTDAKPSESTADQPEN